MFSYAKEFFAFSGLYRFVAPTILALFLSTTLQSLALLMLPFANKIIYDDLLITRDPLFLLFIIAFILVFNFFGTASTFLVDVCSGHLRTKLAGLLREFFFKRLINYKMKFFQEHETGPLVQNLVADIDVISQVLTQLCQFFAYVIQLCILFLVIGLLDRDIMAVYGVVLVLYMLWSLFWKRPVENSSKRIGDEYGNLYGFFYEAIPGIREIKLQGIKNYIMARLARNNAKLKRQQMLNALYNSFLYSSVITIPWLSFCVILLIGIRKIGAGEMTVGTLATLFFMMWNLFASVDKISTIFNTFNNAFPAAQRVNALRGDHHEQILEGPSMNFQGKIEFRGVGFSYDGKRRSLEGVDLTIRKGSRIAIVGHSGSGKSTLLNLLLRFHEGYEGEIQIDGKSISALCTDRIRELFCVVVQDPFLFNDTIRGNIDFSGSLTASEVMGFCDQAHLGNFIRSLPQGLETQVGERATKISGGEKQRIALARALARRAQILILDEATSALDPVTESLFRGTIRHLWESRQMTVISITHRASIAQDSDYIYLMENGKVAEHGSHSELILRQGLYYRMFSGDDHRKSMKVAALE
jgi:ABC-type multidrug transport system fused ATPase/permease subunit